MTNIVFGAFINIIDGKEGINQELPEGDRIVMSLFSSNNFSSSP